MTFRYKRAAALSAGVLIAGGLALAPGARAQTVTWTDTAVEVVQPPTAFVHYYYYGEAEASEGTYCIAYKSPIQVKVGAYADGVLQSGDNGPAPGHVNTWKITSPLPSTMDGLVISNEGAFSDPDTGDSGTANVGISVSDGYGDIATAVVKVTVTSPSIVTIGNPLVSADCIRFDTPANQTGGIQFSATDDSVVAGLLSPDDSRTWSDANVPTGLAPIDSTGLLSKNGTAAPGTYSGVTAYVADSSGAQATVTFTLKVSAQPVIVPGNLGDEVNSFDNGFDVYQQRYLPGAIVAGWTATQLDPATHFVRQNGVDGNAAHWRFEAVNASGIATGLCVSDPGGGWPDPIGPNGLLITPCNSGPFQEWILVTAEPTHLQNVATGLLVSPDGTGVQLRGTSDPAALCPTCNAYYTWKGLNQLP